MVYSIFSTFVSFNLRNYIFQCAKKCEMTSSYMTSLHVDLNEAAKCVDIIPHATHIASLLIAPSHTLKKYKMATIFGLSKKYQNFPLVLGWKFKGNGPVSMGNLREKEISISPLGNYGK